jgi:hypothetical protein
MSTPATLQYIIQANAPGATRVPVIQGGDTMRAAAYKFLFGRNPYAGGPEIEVDEIGNQTQIYDTPLGRLIKTGNGWKQLSPTPDIATPDIPRVVGYTYDQARNKIVQHITTQKSPYSLETVGGIEMPVVKVADGPGGVGTPGWVAPTSGVQATSNKKKRKTKG